MKRILLTAILALGVFLTACTPAEVAAYLTLTPEQQQLVNQRHPELNGTKPQWSPSRHPTLVCIRHHESDSGPYPHGNGYSAQNGTSSASGAYQFIDGTWRTMSARAGHPGYSRAKYAPGWVQDAVALYTVNQYGASSSMTWAGSGC